MHALHIKLTSLSLSLKLPRQLCPDCAQLQIDVSSHRAAPRPPNPMIDGTPESPHVVLLLTHASLHLAGMCGCSRSRHDLAFHRSGRRLSVHGPGTPLESNTWLLTVAQVLICCHNHTQTLPECSWVPEGSVHTHVLHLVAVQRRRPAPFARHRPPTAAISSKPHQTSSVTVSYHVTLVRDAQTCLSCSHRRSGCWQRIST